MYGQVLLETSVDIAKLKSNVDETTKTNRCNIRILQNIEEI